MRDWLARLFFDEEPLARCVDLQEDVLAFRGSTQVDGSVNEAQLPHERE